MGNVHNVNVDRIKARAKSYGMTMAYLNRCLGKHDSFLSCVRNGTDRIDEDELAVIAEKIHTTTAYLTGQTDDPEIPQEAAPEQLSPAKADLIRRVQAMSDEEVQAMSDYAEFVLSKRKYK